MTDIKKKQTTEEEFFAEDELKKRKALREKLDQDRKKQETEAGKSKSWMKCPKCTGDLEHRKFEDLVVDVCNKCHGIWLDNGELEIILNSHSGIFHNLIHWHKKK